MKDTSPLITQGTNQNSFSIDSIENDQPKLYNKSKKWTNKQLIIFCIMTAILAVIISNMDRIIDALQQSDNINNDNMSFDYIIVGGGISGLSQMEFINYNDKDKKIKKLLIEKSDRIGGRAFSLNVSYLNETVLIEHGAAMRFTFNEWLYKFLKYLNLCDSFIKMNTSSDPDVKEYLFRNIRYNESIDNYTLNDYYDDIFNYGPNDDSVDFGLIRQQFYDENNNGSAPQNYEEAYDCLYNWSYNGAPIISYSQYSIWKSVFHVSVEYVYQRINSQYPPWIDANVDFCNMASFFPWISFGKPDNVTGGQHTIRGGYNKITQTIYNKLIDDSQEMNQFLLNNEVITVQYNHDKTLSDKRYGIILRNVYDNTLLTKYFADHVILAIPPINLKPLLSRIEPFCDYHKNGICYKINDKVYNLIYSKTDVEYGYKVNLIYNNYNEWVEKFNITHYIQSISDLDIRSFYVDDSWRNNNLFSILFYSRKNQAQRLHYLQQSGSKYEFDDAISVSHYNNNTNVEYIPSSQMLVESVLNELSDLLDVNRNELQYPLAAFSQPLGLNDSNMDGLYTWKVNANSYETTKNILRPLDSENIYIISCDYSRSIGSHEGAIYAAIQNTVENLNMENPLQHEDICWH